ncbi:MAG: N-acetyltransferase [Pseudomonadota bacterium]
MKLRLERPDDVSAIRALTYAAFAATSFSDGTEGAIPDKLRRDGDLVLSLLAEASGVVIGQVSVSPATVGGAEGWYGIGPIAVAPDRFRQGIGSALIHAAIGWALGRGAAGLVLTGSDEYYPRFGFEAGEVSYLTTPRRYCHRLVLHGPAARGEITFARALQEAG